MSGSGKEQVIAHLAKRNAKALTRAQLDALDDFALADPPSVIEEVERLRAEVIVLRDERDAALAAGEQP